jgi:hypothetical protein
VQICCDRFFYKFVTFFYTHLRKIFQICMSKIGKSCLVVSEPGHPAFFNAGARFPSSLEESCHRPFVAASKDRGRFDRAEKIAAASRDLGGHFFWGGGQQPLGPLLLLGPQFFPIILFGSTTLLTGVTGNSLHMQWPLTSYLFKKMLRKKQLKRWYVYSTLLLTSATTLDPRGLRSHDPWFQSPR